MLEINLAQSSDLPTLTEHQPAEFVYPAPPLYTLALHIDQQLLEAFLRPGEAIWRWRWNPGPAVGLHTLSLTIKHVEQNDITLHWKLRVATRKIDQDRYEELLDDIQQTAYGVLISLAGSGAEGSTLQRMAPWPHSPAESYYALFEQQLEVFERAVHRIANHPRAQLRTYEQAAPLGQSNELGAATLANLAQGQFDTAPPEVAPKLQKLLRPGGGLLPRSLPSTRGIPTTDTYEHRLLKHLLGLLLRRARNVRALAQRLATQLAANEAFTGHNSTRWARATAIAAGSTRAIQTLRELQQLPFLAEVGPLSAFHGATSLLQHDAAYRAIYRMWQALQQHPYIAFESPLFTLPIADLPRLYEAWCAIQVAQALLTLGGHIREQHLISQQPSQYDTDSLEYIVTLNEDTPLLVIEREQYTFCLRYQPRYRPLKTTNTPSTNTLQTQPTNTRLGSLDRHTRIPDLAIEIRQGHTPTRVLLLDAKYRLDSDGNSVPPDALADAYSYFAAIGAAGGRTTIGAVLLYPGLGQPERYSSGVGTIPLVPNHTQELAPLLKIWLMNTMTHLG